MGVHNYSIEMTFVNEQLKDDYEIIYIDRAGYGYSDDTSKTQTVEQIVSDYRTALKSVGIEGPYILMPHSIGGVYATYWESTYPDEIEGVIFIDGTPLGMNIYENEDYSVSFSDYFDVLLCKLGMQRFSIRDVSDSLPSEYTKEQQKLTDYLNIKSSMNKAPLSEIKEKNNNVNKAYQSIKSNDIQKIYIESSRGARTIEEVATFLNIGDQWQKCSILIKNNFDKEKVIEFKNKFMSSCNGNCAKRIFDCSPRNYTSPDKDCITSDEINLICTFAKH